MREAVFAGYFYPSKKEELEKMISSFFEKSFKEVKERKNAIGIVSPHAGYIYSGLTASYAFSSLPRNINKTFIIIGPNHTGYGKEVSVYPKGIWKTPLGEIEIDEEFAQEIIKNSEFAEKDEIAHLEEHSIEVQLPFLQFLYKRIKIVPICLLNQSKEVAEDLAKAILKTKRDFVLVASSDFNHYEEQQTTLRKDLKLIDAIISLDLDKFYSVLIKERVSACGYGGIAVLMKVTEELKGKIELIKHSTSGDINKDYSSVVGYASLIAFKE
ncbi:MAG: MEMO1 family protein [Candidatus Aenigmatarchaeota archaeon]